MLEKKLFSPALNSPGGLKLVDGSRVGVMGGGPAGTFFSYFLLDMAARIGLELQVDIFEPRDFSITGPGGCNMCGGIISESLVQLLAAEGINLPAAVVQRGIASYILHMAEGDAQIDTPLREKRIAVVHRGSGPRGIKEIKWGSFDAYLLKLATDKGARLVPGRVVGLEWKDSCPQVRTQSGTLQTYDLLAAAVGVNTAALKLFEGDGLLYQPPRLTKTYINEFFLGQELVDKCLGSSMHVFLLNLPRLEFAALIPKGDYVTLCLLGKDIDATLIQSFLEHPKVRQCLPPGWNNPADTCHCSPRINIEGAVQPYADRMVFIGDCGVTRLYKDGIGAAYRVAKAAARTAIFEGISAGDFQKHYWPVCRAISTDNRIGKALFLISRLIQQMRVTRRGVLSRVNREQQQAGRPQRMSMIMWDIFTGSAPYQDILLRTFHPAFIAGFLWDTAVGLLPKKKKNKIGD